MVRRRNRYDDRGPTITSPIIGLVLVCAWILSSAQPAQAHITPQETRHYAWLKLTRALASQARYQPTLGDCWLETAFTGQCRYVVYLASGKGVTTCTGALRVQKTEYDQPRGYAPRPAPTFKTTMVGDPACQEPA